MLKKTALSMENAEHVLESVELSLKKLLVHVKFLKKKLQLEDDMVNTTNTCGDESVVIDVMSNVAVDTIPVLDANEKDFVPVTYFSSCTVSFNDVLLNMDHVNDKDLIPVEVFLEACLSFAEMFDWFAGKLLTPLRTDVLSNVEKIKQSSVKEKVIYLQVVDLFIHCLWVYLQQFMSNCIHIQSKVRKIGFLVYCL